jgi:hypothetical protein
VYQEVSVLVAFQRFWRNVGLREVSHRIAARFEEQDDVLTVGDPRSTETHAHAPPQRLGIQKSLRQWLGN